VTCLNFSWRSEASLEGAREEILVSIHVSYSKEYTANL
jgi:hypothetical protein